ncbi:MAG: bifunctional diaminohydroxyphosphoribosylaminopyrimidine deaminase/5-amino-6-(5-phosphoribosylamino)uracil reductase RibD [Eubacteriaceae bacterium]|nr:bifunctional diaminohydroxyphosphoribosylaminopyrimidine deaminase/5-amino-6-(5-phosphoribosylamino)uracil reductase RibD [Eubacteriaceae bacterium]
MKYMKRAAKLAEKGRGYTNPNPVVGAVIVKDGRVIGEGYHEVIGGLHAERNALASCSEDPQGADMYVTLEPCCHYGKTPPCTEAIIENRIGHVYVGSGDPNPLVAGKGIAILRRAGISVTENVMKEKCDELNKVFFHYIKTGMPYVTLKYAMTADGKIASFSGKSKWITGEEARKDVHRLRHENAAIMVGIGTVLADDPLLNCRIENGKDPVRVICDTHLRIPSDSQIVGTAGEIKTIIAVGEEAATDEGASKKIDVLKRAGCRIAKMQEKNGHVDIAQLFGFLGKEQLDSLLIEGGGRLAWSAVESGLVDRVTAYTAPKIFGGEAAKTPVEGRGFESPQQAAEMEVTDIKMLGRDIMTEYEVKKCSRE